MWEQGKKILLDPKLLIDRLLPGVGQIDVPSIEEDVRAAQSTLGKIEAEEDGLLSLFIKDKITESQLDRQRQFITERLEAARVSLESAELRLQGVRDRSVNADSIRDWAAQLRTGIEMLSRQERQTLLHRVTISGEREIKLVLAIPTAEFIADEATPQNRSLHQQ